jgi:hypothetical protein
MRDADEEIAALRAKLIPEPAYNYREEFLRACKEIGYWHHKAMVLGAEVTARNAANIELGEMLRYAQEQLMELSGIAAKGAGTNPDFVHANASLVEENKLDSAKAPGSPTLSGGDGPGVSYENYTDMAMDILRDRLKL